MTTKHEYHVAYGPLSGGINVGRVSKVEPVFLDKQQCTDEVVAVVGEYVRGEYGDGKTGGMEATYEAMDMRVTVRVRPMDSEPEDVTARVRAVLTATLAAGHEHHDKACVCYSCTLHAAVLSVIGEPS